MTENTTAINLAGFEHYASSLLPGIKRQYDRGVNRDLSQQHSQDLFKRNVTGVLKQAYHEALTQLQQIAFEREESQGVEVGTSLTKRVLKPFSHLIDELIQYAVQKHRTSCALSNFPAEHNPSQDYIAEVIQEVSRDWAAFVSQVTKLISR
jgi:hypothetical protein